MRLITGHVDDHMIASLQDRMDEREDRFLSARMNDQIVDID